MNATTRAVAATALLAALVLAAGCGGADPVAEPPAPPATTATTMPEVPPTPAPDVPTPPLDGIDASDAALIAGYRGWTALTTPPIPELRGLGSAHAGARRVWTNIAADDVAYPYPRGTVIVKEGRTGADVTLVAIMEKVRANDDTTGGWRYAEYTRDGSADFTKVGFPESGCAGCHLNANTRQKTDWVFYALK